MLQPILKKIIFFILSILPVIVLFFFFAQSDAAYVLQAEVDQIESSTNTSSSETEVSNSVAQNLQIQEFIQKETEVRNIPVQSVKIIDLTPSYVVLQTTVSSSVDSDTANQSIQVLLDADLEVVETQIHRLELVLKGVEFSKMSETIQEIDVRFKLPVMRTQKTIITP